METRRDERIKKLAYALQQTDKIHLKEAAQLLGVSEMTVRRDLSEPCLAVQLLGGYIVSDPKNSHARYFISDQQTHNAGQKQRLGQLAATLIQKHDTVFFDCGTTIPWIIKAIDHQLEFTAICCAMNTFLALQEKAACRVFLNGGEFHSDNAIFTPQGPGSVMDNLCPDKAFISAAGIDAVQGATCYNLNELPIKHLALLRARQKILVADSSKFGKVLSARIGDLDLFNRLITNEAAPNALAQRLQQSGVVHQHL
ncbi:DNA-binding transcriptional repressor DeoR [Erwinia psidii]|uniref:DNA-binding transcriptional repressor DeoR n=1 Tax=Erwinia psidii TaxID=69224 RepID=A0A3N6S470_9GAMM|nr:DNA-binding transcriptional repressor DeoR [Erwinia psidii]MCX8957491.1 DNA-binding transcriptional repressor DeoR [Erwinia psidii]RQM39687.1 DNA-binding transcriptional repressor DeoR [Erwinia psidii]